MMTARMPRKRNKPDQDSAEGAVKQISFRAPVSLSARVDAVAKLLGLDPSNFLRMMLLECLPLYEQRARAITEGKAVPGGKPEE